MVQDILEPARRAIPLIAGILGVIVVGAWLLPGLVALDPAPIAVTALLLIGAGVAGVALAAFDLDAIRAVIDAWRTSRVVGAFGNDDLREAVATILADGVEAAAGGDRALLAAVPHIVERHQARLEAVWDSVDAARAALPTHVIETFDEFVADDDGAQDAISRLIETNDVFAGVDDDLLARVEAFDHVAARSVRIARWHHAAACQETAAPAIALRMAVAASRRELLADGRVAAHLADRLAVHAEDVRRYRNELLGLIEFADRNPAADVPEAEQPRLLVAS